MAAVLPRITGSEIKLNYHDSIIVQADHEGIKLQISDQSHQMWVVVSTDDAELISALLKHAIAKVKSLKALE